MDTNQKLENSLNIAVELNPEEREESESLQVGFDEESQTWKLIVQYSGDIRRIETLFEGAKVSELFHQFAIVTIPERYLEALATLPEIEYIEKPKPLYFNANVGRSASCINSVQGRVSEDWNGTGSAVPEAGGNRGLTGRGVLVGIVDSGERVIIMSDS